MSNNKSATKPPATTTTLTTVPPPDSLQLEVVEDYDNDGSPVDEELVLATDDLDDYDDISHSRQQHNNGNGGNGKKKSRFSLPRITLPGRKQKARYSRVTADHIALASSHKTAQPHTTATTSTDFTATSSSAETSDETSDGRRKEGSCVTCLNFWLLVALCVTIYLAGFIGWTIARRSSVAAATAAAHPRLIVISIDGFSSTYLTTYADVLPNIKSFQSAGLSAVPLTPVFPSSTFPNHYTLVTGLYPTEHGIVANSMYNASSNEWFIVGLSTNASYWWQGEPVWSTAQRWALTSAVLNWPGSDVLIGGRRPTVWAAYNGAMSDSARVERLMSWLDGDACTLCMIYFSTVDSVGHASGPLSDEMRVALAAMDVTIGSVVSGLTERGLLDSVNVMLVSDHGMTAVNSTRADDNTRLVLLDHYTNHTDYILTYSGTLAHILPTNPDTADDLYADITTLPNCTAYYDKNRTMPADYHYNIADNPRIPPIVVTCQLGVLVMNSSVNADGLKGAHGYLGSEVGMGAVLMVRGVGVSEAGVGKLLEGTSSTDVYGLMCWLLGISPARNDGDMTQFSPYLQHGRG